MHLKDIKPKHCPMPPARRIIWGCQHRQARAQGQSSAKRDTAAVFAVCCTCDIPHAIVTGPTIALLLRAAMLAPAAPCLLTCASTRHRLQLLPGRLHSDTKLFLGSGSDGDGRGEDFWGRWV